MGQEGVLLAFVETVDLIDEEDGPPSGVGADKAGTLNRVAYVLDA